MTRPGIIYLHRKFSKKVTSVRNWISSNVVGNEDFRMGDILSSEYDLKYASKNFKFALVPKVSIILFDFEFLNLIITEIDHFN